MTVWDGKERRGEIETLSAIYKIMEAHIKEDTDRFNDLIEKVHNIDIKLSNLVVLNTETLKSQMTMVSNNQIMIMKHNDFLFGNGNGDKGMSVRMNLLEGYEESRKWTFRVMWTAIITMFTKVLYDVIKK